MAANLIVKPEVSFAALPQSYIWRSVSTYQNGSLGKQTDDCIIQYKLYFGIIWKTRDWCLSVQVHKLIPCNCFQVVAKVFWMVLTCCIK